MPDRRPTADDECDDMLQILHDKVQNHEAIVKFGTWLGGTVIVLITGIAWFLYGRYTALAEQVGHLHEEAAITTMRLQEDSLMLRSIIVPALAPNLIPVPRSEPHVP